MRLAHMAVCWVWAMLFSATADAVIQDLSFAEAEAETTKQSLVFFASGQDATLRSLLEDMSSFSDSFIYVYVDCEAKASRDKCAAASFNAETLPRVFLNSVEGGIESVSPADRESILSFLEFRSSPVAGERVLQAESDAHLEELLAKGRHVVVKYFQTWCSHCKRYKKHFQQSSTLFGSSAPVEILFVDVDCTLLEKSCRNSGVSSYPTLKFYDATNDMQPIPVKARDHTELSSFLKEHAQPISKASAAAEAPSAEADLSQLSDDVLYARAIENANANELDNTVLYFRELQRRNPRDAQRNSNLGTALMRKGNGPAAYPSDFLVPYEEAMKFFNIALELDPTSGAAMEGMQALVGNIRYRGTQSGVSEAEIETIIRRAQRRNGLNPRPGLYHADAATDEWEEDDDWDSDEDEEDWEDDDAVKKSNNNDDGWGDVEEEDWTDEL